MDSIKMTAEQQLPEGWKKYNLFDICRPKQWKTIAVKDLKNEGYPVYGANGIIGFHNEFNHEKETLLIGCRGSCGEIHISQPKSYINGNAMCLDELSDNILLYYLYYFLKGYNFKSIISGSTQPQITQIGLRKVEIPIPPLETQQAIVNKIESLFDEIDEGIGRLKTAAQQIQQYRQSLLKNAFNGELTKEWRSKHADALPSENELFAQIQTAREQHHAQQLADWQTAVSQWEQNGKEGKKLSKPKASTQAVKFEENFADLPRGWGVVKLENIAEINSGMSVSANRKLTNPIAVNYLRVGNVQRGYLDLEEIKEMKIEAESFNKYRLRFGDVLFNEGGDRDKLGRGWIWENQVENCITQNHVFRASPFLKSITHSKYISYLGNSRYGKSYFEETGKQTTNLASINKTVLSNFPVKLPSLAEQTQIVAILESKLTACDQLADELAKQLKQAEMLKQAVLKAAFSGGLLDK
ncbi:type I restriction modification DNA specificity domain protein [Neisseria sp. HMSC06F02]|nr:type I restriction modification DNA specificity domain protein [Neisseria sp. HMSC06F02]